jgi:hypothetical protein
MPFGYTSRLAGRYNPQKEMSEVGWFRAANRHFKQAGNIVKHDSFKATFVGGLPRQVHTTIHPSYGRSLIQIYLYL